MREFLREKGHDVVGGHRVGKALREQIRILQCGQSGIDLHPSRGFVLILDGNSIYIQGLGSVLIEITDCGIGVILRQMHLVCLDLLFREQFLVVGIECYRLNAGCAAQPYP